MLCGIPVSKVFTKLEKALFDYLVDNPKIDSLIIGISGGIDCAVVALISRLTIDNFNCAYPERNVYLAGYSLPILNNVNETERADRVIESICHRGGVYDMSDMYNDLKRHFDIEGDSLESRIQLGNLQARLRMIRLYDYAYAQKGMVMGTTNLSEYMLGFWTLHGDIGDFDPIISLFKTDVYELANCMVEKLGLEDSMKEAMISCIEATPTDGLGISDSDNERFGGLSYLDIDKNIQNYLINLVDPDPRSPKINEVVLDLINKTHFKRDNPHCVGIF